MRTNCKFGRYSSEIRTGCANERPSGSVRGCALKAHGIQLPEMATAAKLSSQPRTESCVVANTALRSVDREVVGRNKVNGKIAPKSNVIGVADPVSQRGRRNRRPRNSASVLRCSRGSYRQHATKGINVNTGDPFSSNESL